MIYTTWLANISKLNPSTARSLSLLFILQEITSLFYLLSRSKERCKENISILQLPEELEDYLHLTIEDPSPKQEISLTKLSFYADILLQCSKLDEIILLQRLEVIRSVATKIKFHFFIAKRQTPPKKDIFEMILQELISCDHAVNSFFFSLIPFLKETRTDENILIYLIEQKEILNQYLQENTIETLFQLLFPEGESAMRAILHEGFTRRSFTQFLQTKEELIHSFNWKNHTCAY